MEVATAKAFIFDVFGTTVDWRTNVVSELQAAGIKYGVQTDWNVFAQKWRNTYFKNSHLISEGKLDGPLSVDVMHRQILDELLSSPEYSDIGEAWNEDTRKHVNLSWHRLCGWPDTVEGMQALKKHAVVVGLSNGNLSLLIDMAKHANLPWDAILSTELFDTYKPNAKAYKETLRHLQLPPSQCVMVAAHMWDLRAAAKVGMTTVYVRRPDEDAPEDADVHSKHQGGEVDYVVDDFFELSKLFKF